jgi:hypothetical protein
MMRGALRGWERSSLIDDGWMVLELYDEDAIGMIPQMIILKRARIAQS